MTAGVGCWGNDPMLSGEWRDALERILG
uniref:Uncharacterized protein n=1 Tax=Nelumbo nucifera TaxID=4432 RepID=A0A822XLK9_NELNU|nr:TPA_asm: hypothetical protein HUJ06_019881 [Nelumbo nucifera]